MRHGESEDGAAGLHQRRITPLTPAGVNQAELVAARLSKSNDALVLSSPLERAKQTAEVVANSLRKPVEYSDLFVEMRDPSEILGKPVKDPGVVGIKRAIREHVGEPNWRYSDEETALELRGRAIQALQYLINLNKENIILVTHGAFSAMLFDVMAFGREVEPSIYLQLRNFMWDHNAGLTVCKYSDSRWKMLFWNDYSHLS